MTGTGSAPISVEEAAPTSYPAVARLVATVFREGFDLALDEAVARDLESCSRAEPAVPALVLVANAGGRTVGALVGHGDGASAPFTFHWLCVETSSSGHGIGRSLLSRALELCAERGISSVTALSLAASPIGPRLYWSCGFRVVDVVSRLVAGRPREVIVFGRP